MSRKEMRKKIHSLMVKNNMDMIALPARTAILVGVEYVTLKGKTDIQGINFEEKYVPIDSDFISIIYGVIRKMLKDVHLYELTEEEINDLLDEILFGSVYLADYNNSFGVKPEEVSDYADGFLEVKDEYNSFYDYIQTVEFCE